MSAQDERPLPTANGVTPDRQVADAGTSQSTAVTGNVSTLEERADGPVDATMLEPTGQAAYTPEAPPTYHNPAPGDESVQQQERQRRPATTVALDGDQDSGRVVQGAVASGFCYVIALTTRGANVPPQISSSYGAAGASANATELGDFCSRSDREVSELYGILYQEFQFSMFKAALEY
ncbi:hypothetical protein AK812_SmicGene34161 [Symbiodinium microadriaticum]|uniref:Uncharacterized protein n=1 Tax=Symbiodinium microadriaticum TaxID=2951 RepID=A0A1Q9CPQ0_SYMMI|nr:hypothetical protein AK812_SmicGene34161 [Symbiodinium microadriaticum]